MIEYPPKQNNNCKNIPDILLRKKDNNFHKIVCKYYNDKLLEYVFDDNIKTDYLVYFSIKYNNFSILKYLIDNGHFNPDIDLLPFSQKCCKKLGSDIINYLINMNLHDFISKYLLKNAVYLNIESIKLLDSNGFQLIPKNNNEKKYIFKAIIECNDIKKFSFYYENLSKIFCFYDIYYLSIIYGSLNITKWVITHGNIDIHENLDWGLRYAAKYGNLETVIYLIENNCDIHIKNDYAFRKACENCKLDVIKYLYSKGANIHTRYDYALRKAAISQEPNIIDVLKYLLSIGCNINSKNDYALRKVISRFPKSCDLVKFLLENGANIHVNNDYPLKESLINAEINPEIPILLIKYDASIFSRGHEIPTLIFNSKNPKIINELFSKLNIKPLLPPQIPIISNILTTYHDQLCNHFNITYINELIRYTNISKHRKKNLQIF